MKIPAQMIIPPTRAHTVRPYKKAEVMQPTPRAKPLVFCALATVLFPRFIPPPMGVRGMGADSPPLHERQAPAIFNA